MEMNSATRALVVAVEYRSQDFDAWRSTWQWNKFWWELNALRRSASEKRWTNDVLIVRSKCAARLQEIFRRDAAEHGLALDGVDWSVVARTLIPACDERY